MRPKKLISVIRIMSVTLMLVGVFGFSAHACTDIVVGKAASVDGSVITSHTCDGPYDSRIIVIPAADHNPGEMAPVYKNIIRAYPQFPKEERKYFRSFGELEQLGEIPEVPHTYQIFKIAYPFANEHQVIIGETTLGNEKECSPNPDTTIMYIEQLEIFGLQRAKTAREVIQVMGELAEKYGYADAGECLTVSDPQEVWVFEIYPVGPFWTPESGTPGAVWCAQRVPDDHITTVPNRSRIVEIDPNDSENFMFSSNYMDAAIELGLYDPNSGEPFIWKFTYRDCRKRDDSRTWRVYSKLAPSGNWQFTEQTHYPFSVKPDQKVSFQDVIALFRDTMVGTPYDMTEDPDWYVRPESGEHKGEWVKSSFASPQVTGDWMRLLDIPYVRPIARYGCSYYFVSQARDWLPNDIGGVLWFGLDNPENGVFVPLYVGNTEVPPSWCHLDRTKFDRESAWWAFATVDDLVNQRYGYLKPILDEVLVPMQQEMFANQESIEQEALKLSKTDPAQARKLLTDYTYSLMEKTEQVYWDLFERFLFETNNNSLSLDY